MSEEIKSVQDTADNIIKRFNDVIALLVKKELAGEIELDDVEYVELLKSTCATFIVTLFAFTSASDEELKLSGLYVHAVRTVGMMAKYIAEIEESLIQPQAT